MAWDDGDKGNPWRSDKDKGPADLDAVVRELSHVNAGTFQFCNITDRDTADALHNHHLGAGQVPVDRRHVQKW